MKIPKDQIKRKKNTKTTRTTNQPIKQKMEKIQDNRKAKQKWKYKKIYILKKKKEKNKGKEHRTTEKQSKNINI